MERVDLPTVATFFSAAELREASTVELGEEVAHHMRVRRIEPGERVRLHDGRGGVATAVLRQLTKRGAAATVEGVERHPPPPAVHVRTPVADRDRMLWLAEKCAELGASSWRAVRWARSRSVSPRGEGAAFEGKARARMAAALAQCEGAWAPAVHPDLSVDELAREQPTGTRVLLDVDGAPLAAQRLTAPVTLVIGPEGGVERAERDRLVAAGFTLAALPGNVLRFETAGVAALALAMAALTATAEESGDR